MKNRPLQTLLIGFFCLNAFSAFALNYYYQTVNSVTGWRGGLVPSSPTFATDNIVIDANYTWYAVFISHGTLTVNAGKKLNIGQFTNNGALINKGTITMNGVFTNGAEGLVTNNGIIGVDYVSGGENALLSNFGLLNIHLGSTLTIGDPIYALPNAIRNEMGGRANIYGTVSNYSFWYNQAGSTLSPIESRFCHSEVKRHQKGVV